jgi:hypothetical protein
VRTVHIYGSLNLNALMHRCALRQIVTAPAAAVLLPLPSALAAWRPPPVLLLLLLLLLFRCWVMLT